MEDGLQGPRGVVLNRDLPPVRDAGEEELSADLVREMVKDALPEEVCEQVEWTRLRLTADWWTRWRSVGPPRPRLHVLTGRQKGRTIIERIGAPVSQRRNGMRETTFEVHVPADLLDFGLGRDEIQRHVTEWLVLSLFTDGHVSSGKAAKLLDITRVEFLRLLRRRGVAYIDYSAEELEDEFKAVETLEIDTSE